MRVNDEQLLKQVGRRIQTFRRLRGITQAELEDRTGLSDVGNYERGERNPTLVTLSRLARALDVTVKDLVDIAGRDDEEEEIRAQVLDLLSGCDSVTRRKAAEMLKVFLR